ncbi:MAG: hypothetical protein NTZ16_06280 [Verrucomicrobia bacterium]|nr:hypothetical protein [Verrucomicrobiota bacterium]
MKMNFAKSDRRLLAIAFSLIEMMITVALLGFIVVGLTAMFVQTQRAFRGGMAQTDVLEAGRATSDLLARELELAQPAYLANANFYVQPQTNNFQSLPGSSMQRKNTLGEFFFLTRSNLTWTGIGYFMDPVTNGVGTLYRYQTNASGSQTPGLPSIAGKYALSHRVADGIVHLRLQAYNTNGVLLDPPIPGAWTNVSASWNLGEIAYTFTSNAVPAYVELELGVLEYPALKKLQALPSAARAAYLAREQTAGRVHIFRRHIAVRNVDPEAYR